MKEELLKKIYNYLNLDKKLNRILFIFGTFFSYWFLFYAAPFLLLEFIYEKTINVSIVFSSVFKSIFILFFSKELISIINDQQVIWPTYFLLYLFVVAPILIILPIFVIYRILPKINKLIIILLGGWVIVFNIIYIFIYIYNSLIIAPMSPQIW